MKETKGIKRKSAVLILCLLFVIVQPFIASAGVCESAVERCAFEAVIAGIFGGPYALFGYVTGCAVGYQWCLKYFVPEVK